MKLVTERVLGMSLLGCFLIILFDIQGMLAQQLVRVGETRPSAASQPHSRLQMDESQWTILQPRPDAVFPPSLFPESPSLLNSIEGINFDEDAANSGFYHIPPDPSGAAGPNHLVSVVNTSIEWFTKAGVQQHSGSLSSFFSSLSPQTNTFDPKVIYDQYNNRFVVLTLEQVDSPQRSRIFVAVSDDSDPNGTWYFLDINSLLNIGGINTWADYPGLAVSAEAVYITANMFSFSGLFQGSRLWIIDKTGFYSGGTAVVNRYDPSAGAGLSSSAFTLQPAHMFGTAPSGVGTFLVNTMWSDGAGNDFVSIIRVDDPLGTSGGPTFTNQFVGMGNVHNNSAGIPSAPQSGTATELDFGDTRTINAVWRNNTLWTVFAVNPPSGSDGGQATVHWIKVNTSTLGSLTLDDQGNLGGEDIASGCYTSYPSVAVNGSGEAAVGFAASASSIFPGAYYAARSSSDPPGTFQHSAILRQGVDYYVRTLGGGSNRWGDYSAISVDPTDDRTFWVFNEYALSRGTVLSGEDGRWGTAFGSFTLAGQPLPNAWINEFHYDNGNPDQNEFVEVVVPSSFTDLANLTLSLYDGATGTVYATHKLSTFTAGNSVAGFTIYYKDIPGIQDGPDGMALDYLGSTIQFLSYEGTFVAKDGPAFTTTSTDIGVSESASTSANFSLQLQGTGTNAGNFTWAGPIQNTKGAENTDQSLPVELAFFTASGMQDRIVLKWRTESEIQNLGFEIWRAEQEDGDYQMLSSYRSNAALQGRFNSSQATDYQFEDRQVIPGRVYWYRLTDVDVNGQKTEHGPISALIAEQTPQLTTLNSNQPDRLRLFPNFPNPFNPTTTLRLDVPASSRGLVRVNLMVVSATGQVVRTLLNGTLPAGQYEVVWDGRDNAGRLVSSGVYFAVIQADYKTQYQKMVLVR